MFYFDNTPSPSKWQYLSHCLFIVDNIQLKYCITDDDDVIIIIAIFSRQHNSLFICYFCHKSQCFWEFYSYICRLCLHYVTKLSPLEWFIHVMFEYSSRLNSPDVDVELQSNTSNTNQPVYFVLFTRKHISWIPVSLIVTYVCILEDLTTNHVIKLFVWLQVLPLKAHNMTQSYHGQNPLFWTVQMSDMYTLESVHKKQLSWALFHKTLKNIPKLDWGTISYLNLEIFYRLLEQ